MKINIEVDSLLCEKENCIFYDRHKECGQEVKFSATLGYINNLGVGTLYITKCDKFKEIIEKNFKI